MPKPGICQLRSSIYKQTFLKEPKLRSSSPDILDNLHSTIHDRLLQGRNRSIFRKGLCFSNTRDHALKAPELPSRQARLKLWDR